MRFEVGGVALELVDSSSDYAPSDDTQMLPETALTNAHDGYSVLEIGTGSGAVILTLAKSSVKFTSLVAVDINADAVKTARANAKANKIESVKFFQSDLFASLPASSHFNLILFNPPYLPTANADKVAGSLNAAFDGGRDGLKVVRRFLARVGKHLAPSGHILLVVSSLQPKDKLEKLLVQHHFSYCMLSSQSFFFENLQVWELSASK
ncbi:putative S-adenosylmethionine-dependent methyltransferase [uncultured archaeon]|nr:putative S-adenosylmethionine-dependent methyltransferase [uncultured archaeon]